MRDAVTAAGDLPIPTSIPWWMGLAMILVWLAVVLTAFRLAQRRLAMRRDRRERLRRRPTTAGAPPLAALNPSSGDAPE